MPLRRGLAAAALLSATAFVVHAGGFDPSDEPAPPSAPSGSSGPDTPPRAATEEPIEHARPDPAARLPGGSQGSEYWDLMAKFDSGHFVFARFLLTNLGPGAHNAVVLGHVVTPSGERVRFRNGRRRARWQLSDDHLALDVNKCHLDLHDRVARLRVEKGSVQLELQFALVDGAVPPLQAIPKRYASETLAANAPVAGHLTLRGAPGPIRLSGVGAVLHTWTEDPEEQRVERRLDFFTLTRDLGVRLSEIRTPDGKSLRWLRTTGPGATQTATTHVILESSGQLAGLTDPYRSEARLDLDSTGVRGSIALQRVLHQQDPLSSIPEPLRTLVGWGLSMDPHQAWATADYDLAIYTAAGNAPTALRGEGVAAIAFLRKP